MQHEALMSEPFTKRNECWTCGAPCVGRFCARHANDARKTVWSYNMTLKCPECSHGFTPSHNRQRYCSKACRKNASNRRYRQRRAA